MVMIIIYNRFNHYKKIDNVFSKRKTIFSVDRKS